MITRLCLLVESPPDKYFACMTPTVTALRTSLT